MVYFLLTIDMEHVTVLADADAEQIAAMTGVAPGSISVRLFGAPLVCADGQPVRLGRRARGVIANLLMTDGHRVTRERLMGLFWPDRGEAQARASLRQCLVEIRTGTGALVTADRETVALAGPVDSDWTRLNASLVRGDAAALTDVLGEIRAEPLLEGLEFGEAVEDWVRTCRARNDARVAAAVLRHLTDLRAAGDWDDAIALADAWLQRDPLDEAVAAAAIGCEVARGAPAAARRRFRQFEALLAREGDGPPSAALKAALTAAPLPDRAAETPSTPIELATGAELRLPSKPSIAILPFADLTGGDLQDAFADGMTEELSTVLSRFSTLFVIAGQSSLSYRGSTKPAQQIARELGVRYLLEGSVRKAGGRVRIAVKLVDAPSGAQIWAERFDGDYEDIFDLQDRVAGAVASTIDATVTDAEFGRALVRPAVDPDAYELNLRANAKLNLYTRESITEALALAEQAVALDPTYAWAVAIAGFCHGALYLNQWTDAPAAAREKAIAYARESVRLGPDDQLALAVAAGAVLNVVGDAEFADGLIERAMALNPEKAFTLFWAAWTDITLDRPQRALERFEKTIRLNPRSLYRPFQLNGMGTCLFFLDRFEEAVVVLAEVIRILPQYVPAYTVMIAALVKLGRHKEAAAACERCRELGGAEYGLRHVRSERQVGILRATLAQIGVVDAAA